MPLLTRSEYNLILRSFDSYNYLMNDKEKELREQLEEKLYNNFYNPLELPDLSNNLDNKPVIENGQYVPF